MPPPDNTFREPCKALGWRQGSAITQDFMPIVLAASCDLHPVLSSPDSRLVLTTQTCDLLQGLESEPWAEAIPLHPLLSFNRGQDTRCLYGRNPRRLVFSTLKEGGDQWWEVKPHGRFRFDKQKLLGSTPDESMSLSLSNLAGLTRWLAARYVRPALPDRFVERMGHSKVKFDELFQVEAFVHITGIYLHGAEGELEPEEFYRIRAILSYKDSIAADPELFRQVQEASDQFEALLGACPGINLLDCRLDPEQDLTLRDLRACKRLDRDYRSQDDDSRSPAVVDPM